MFKDKQGVGFKSVGREPLSEADKERRGKGWEQLNYMLLGMCLVGTLWAAVSLKYC